jgi:thiamine biosynthesis lipoprotein
MKTLNIFFILTHFLFAQEMQTRTQAMMGTLVSLTLPIAEEKSISKAFSYIKSLEKVLSSYDEEALVYILNKYHHVEYEQDLFDALVLSKQYYEDTQGYFDVSIGSLSKKLYHFGEENETIPSLLSLKNASLNIHGIFLSKTAISTDKNITIDLGGMGKGYTVDKVALFLEERNITKGVIALSGDIRCLNTCEIELQSPYDEGSFAKVYSKTAQLSISTSGTYRRYVKDPKNHHLLNPKTASQGQDFVSVSLFMVGNNTKIDAYATAISVMPKEEAYKFLNAHKDIGFVLMETGAEMVFGNLEGLVGIKFFDIRGKVTKSLRQLKTSREIILEVGF